MTYNAISGQFEKSGGSEEAKAFNAAARDFLSGGDGDIVSQQTTLKRPYAKSVWVRSAIGHGVNPITMVPLEFSRRDEAVENSDLELFWRKPAMVGQGRASLADLVKASGGWWKMAGEFFWILDDTWFMRGGIARKSPLAVARPSEMREVLEKGSRELIGWQYTPTGTGSPEILTVDQVVHMKNWNPDNDVRGLSEWEAAELAADTDYSAGTFAKAVMDANGDTGPIVTGEGSISDEQYEQITRVLREKRERNKRGDFRPAFLVGANLKVEDPTLQSVNTDFIAQRLGMRHEIYVAFQVPPSFAEVVPSYSVGAASDRYRNLEENSIPLSVIIAAAMADVVNGHGDRPPVAEAREGDLEVAFNWMAHPIMKQVQAENVECAGKLVDKGMPWTVANEYLGLKLPRFAGDDVGRVPFNLVEIGEGRKAEAGDQKSEGGDQKLEDKNLSEIRKAFEGRAMGVREERKAIAKADKAAAEDAEAARRAELHARLTRARRPWEKRFSSYFGRLLMKARVETLGRIEAAADQGEISKALVEKSGALDLIFDLPEWMTEFIDGMAKISRNAMESARTELWIEELFREDDPAELPPAKVLETLGARENLLKDTSAAIHQDILGTISEGLNDGDTMAEIQARVKSAFNGVNDQRAETIARTETGVAYEVARQATMEEAGVEFKEWLTSGLGNVRDSHLMVDPKIVKITEKFKVGQEMLAHPSDPEGSPEEVINCNCIAIASSGTGLKE
tara:strand:- start:3615 stop:5828 length:2214 start_codon:yes stop_codon:yes gene_type:complete